MTRTLACTAALAASCLLLISACGGGGGEAPKPAATATTAAPAAAPAAPAAPAPGAQATPTTLAGNEEDEAAPLLAWADGEPEEGKAPLAVEFKADVEGGTPPLKYVWKFGDGTPDSNDANPKHTYQKAGKFRADLTVTDGSGDEDADYIDIDVQ